MSLVERLRSRGTFADGPGFLHNPDGPEAATQLERKDSEILRLSDALDFAHAQGFEWPMDPLPVGSIAWQLRAERDNA